MPRSMTLLFVFVSCLVGCGEAPRVGPNPSREEDGPEPAGAAREALSQVSAPIVGGVSEPGQDAVGALVYTNAGRYFYPFCTGTLIAPRWILSAAHCFYQAASDPTWVSFVIGTDARAAGSLPASGRLLTVDRIVVHPGFVGELPRDIALVRLAAPLTDVTPVPLFDGDVETLLGVDATLVGFGAIEGVSQSGSGQKRTAHDVIAEVDADSLTVRFEDQGSCFGDSGGPVLVAAEGGLTVAGINVTLGNCAPGTACDPCRTGSIGLRIDRMRGWIDATMNGTSVDCRAVPTCSCDAACRPDGSCDETACKRGCEQGFNCFFVAPGQWDDPNHCFRSLTPDAYDVAARLTQCAARNTCYDDPSLLACTAEYCGDLLEACSALPDAAYGEAECAEIDTCIAACSTWYCIGRCLVSGSKAGRAAHAPLRDCMVARCANEAPGPALDACLASTCAAERLSCRGPDDPEVVEPGPESVEPAPEVIEPAPEVVEPAPDVVEPAPHAVDGGCTSGGPGSGALLVLGWVWGRRARLRPRPDARTLPR